MTDPSTVLLPTTMVGSYPRPAWYNLQLEGRDVMEAFKVIHNQEAYEDAVRTVLRDQEQAGLDILADGQMWFDDYSMGIGSFLWYWPERIAGFSKEKLAHPKRDLASGSDEWFLDEVGGFALVGEPKRGPLRMAELFRIAQRNSQRPVHACVGAGPVQISTLAHFHGGPIKDRYELAFALADIYRAEMQSLVEAGCKYIQLEDLGAWMPNLSGDKDFTWVNEVINQTVAGIDAHVSWHFCLGNVWGNKADAMTRGGYKNILSHYHDVNVNQFVLDFACREMEDVELLRELPESKTVAVGVIDVRSLEVESPEQVAERIDKVLVHIAPERVTLTTDCGMKQLPRPCAIQKLNNLVKGAELVRGRKR